MSGASRIEHDDWCDANGCRCGKCPCLGPPSCNAADEGRAEANIALSVWSNTCNTLCDEQSRVHTPECRLAADLYDRLNRSAQDRALAARAAQDRARLAAVEALHVLQPWRPWASDCPDPENHTHDDDGQGIADVCWDCPPQPDGYCGECHDEEGASVDWPCATALALDTADAQDAGRGGGEGL